MARLIVYSDLPWICQTFVGHGSCSPCFLLSWLALGYVFSMAYGDPSFIIFAIIFSVVYSLISYYSSAKIALSLAKAQEIQKADNPMLWNIVENLCISRRPADAEALYHARTADQRVCDGTRSKDHAAVAVTRARSSGSIRPNCRACSRTNFRTWAIAIFWFRPSRRSWPASSRSSRIFSCGRFSSAAGDAARGN